MGLLSRDYFTMDDFDFSGKTVFLRLDINSPINPASGEVMGYSRFKAHLQTIRELDNARLVLVSHQSRPGKDDFTSLKDHAFHLSTMLRKKISFYDHLFGSRVTDAIRDMKDGDIIMLENSRFYSEEVSLKNADLETMISSHIVKNLSPLFDYYIIDAFPAIHRNQITLTGFQSIRPNVAGRLIQTELEALEKFQHGVGKPRIAILSGAKINESISVAKSFLKNDTVDFILTGGVVATAFLYAKGVQIGKRSLEFIQKNNKNYSELIDVCREILKEYPDKIVLPKDFLLNPSGKRVEVGKKIPDTELIADIGINSIALFAEHIKKAVGIFLNGPLGMYELDGFSAGTREVFSEVADSNAMTIAGGGHTLSALEKMDLLGKIAHVSTGGGALISYLSGENMPVLEALKQSKKKFSGKSNE